MMVLDGFEWDSGNALKNLVKHGITIPEAEEVFHNQPLLFFEDEKHSLIETRSIAFGQTNTGKLLTLAFTLRTKEQKTFVRIISARPMHRKERSLYEKAASQV